MRWLEWTALVAAFLIFAVVWDRLFCGRPSCRTMIRRALPLVMLGAVLSACDAGTPSARAAVEPAPIDGVSVATVASARVPRTFDAVGTVRSLTQAVISSRASGYVRRVLVREGDVVERGQLLIDVEDTDLRARADAARAALAAANDALEEVTRTLDEARAALRAAEADGVYADTTARRYRKLLDAELISAQDFDSADARRRSTAAGIDQAHARIRSLEAREAQARRRIEQAHADLAGADFMLKEARIVAPMSGIVVDRHVEPGNLAVPGQALMTLDDAAHYRLEAVIPESDVAHVALGRPATVLLDAPDRVIAGRVAAIVPAADPGSRSVTVKIDLPAAPGIRSGTFGRARFAAGDRSALLVPMSALVERGQLAGVYVVDGHGIARLRVVTLGARENGAVEVLSGLDIGERIVTDGVARVIEARRVRAE